ncbi:energy transducer TonB [Robertkochia marina]|uniref:Energy transducer TonB n=1 Tax=Robertkochia marina TaxID=1227945 RepID=A0A4S3M3D3_9FLAO|nr:energy transducer TonB [Robertkochia marina]THD69573.1 energy transducer TonB [Robertkochia marina]TRZ47172.1 energy transducer TonB [Robertkochia marina]
MEPKKNPKADLTRNSGLYFAIGLALVLFITWQAIDWKTYEKQENFEYTMEVEELLDEEVPITEQLNTPPPPPPPAAPEVIEVVEDEEEVEETIIESTETDQEEEIVEVEEIEEVEEEVAVDVPFTVIEDKPMFPACKGVPKAQQFACFKENLDKHVRKTFKYPEIAQEMGIQGRVYVNFRINKDGTITILNTRAPDKSLDEEARRIINKLPKLIPGKQRGNPTPVTFAYPIVFKLN